MKKIMSVLLVATLLMSSMPAFAKEADQLQEVLLSVKERIMDTDDFDEFNSSVMESDSEKLYEFYWSTSKDDTYRNLSVTATQSGIITSYRYYDDGQYSYNSAPTINKMSSDEALVKAQEMADKLNPMLKTQIKAEKMEATESLFSNEYRFNLQRYQNEIPVYNNSGYITVNNDASMITRYSLSYTEGISFGDKDGIITSADAWKYYYENRGAELLYITEYKDGEKIISLVYVPKMSSDEYIDAKTGEVKNIWYRDYYFNAKYSAGGATEDMAVKESARLTEIEVQKLEEVSGLKSKEDAEKAIVNNNILELDDDLELYSVNLYKDYNGEKYLYDLAFETKMGEEYRYARATLDAKTLEIIRWNSGAKSYIEYNKAEDKTQKVDEEVIKAALLKIAPKYFTNNDIDFRAEENEDNTISYKRYVNDIKFTDDYITAEINPENGKLWRFSVNYTDIEFPSPEGIISEEDAIKTMSEKTQMKLYYFTYGKDENSKKADSAELGYKTVDYIDKIDAFTGEITTYSSLGMPEYDDIEGHYAEEIIKTLAKYAIGFEGSEFKPDELITQEEYVTLLMATFSNYSPLIYVESSELTREYKQAQRNGIIKEEEILPDEPLSRENSAIYLIRIMGIEEVAKLDGIYKSKFNDVEENIGYISILNAMGVFNGDENGNFNPKKNLTRADAMIVIYNYLNR